MTDAFGDRLAAAFDARGQLCVGIDPHPYLLRDWSLTDDAAGLREFGLRIVDAVRGHAGIIKPQIAFFERHGSAGYGALEEILAAARSVGLLVIGDVKRGDVGTSVEAYGQAWLTPGSALEVDAITLSAYQGVGSIEAPLELAEQHGKGVFVLAATSNPEAAATQTAIVTTGLRSGQTVAAGIVTDVSEWNAERRRHGRGNIGSAGLVIGATVRFSDYGIDPRVIAREPASPVLGPGFGHQGARFDQLGELYGPVAPYVLVSVSRSILAAGPSGLVDTIGEQAREVASWRN